MNVKDKKNRRLMIIGVLIIAIFIPSFAFATTYTTSLFFQTRLVGATRYYSAGDMRCIVNNATTPAGTGTVAYTVTCKKEAGFSDPTIGTVKTYYASPSGYDNSRYFGSGVSSGEYYFIFLETPNLMIPIASNDVILVTE